MNNYKQLAARSVLAIFAGFAVYFMSFYTAWNSAKKWPDTSEQYYTRQLIRRIDKAIDEYKKTNGALPKTLQSFGDISDKQFDANGSGFVGKMLIEKDGQLLDAWRHPFEYSISGDGYNLTSYGRDGVAGGAGLDCDLTNLNPNPPAAQIGFSDFCNSWSAQYIRAPSLVFALLVTGALLWNSLQSTNTNSGAKNLIGFVIGVFLLIL